MTTIRRKLSNRIGVLGCPVIVLLLIFLLVGLVTYAVGGFRPIAFAGLVWGSYAAAFALLVIVHVAVSIITGTKLRRVRIFISFKHDYESIATELENALADRDIEVVRLPFRQRDHDNVIGESFKGVETADGVVVVPGPEASFVDYECTIAESRHKPIAVIKHLPAQPLAHELYQGYPVFTWDKLHPDGFAPLRRFLNFATNSRGDLLPQFQRILAGTMEWEAKASQKGFLGCVFYLVFALYTFVFIFARRKAEAVQVGWALMIFLLNIAALVVGFGKAIRRRVEGIRVARQKIRTREATFSEFSEIFSSLEADVSILNVLEKEPLKPRDEENQAQLRATERTPRRAQAQE